MEVGGEGDYIPIAALLTTRIIAALCPRIQMGSDKSHFTVSLILRDKSHKQDSVHRLQLLKRKESRSGFEPRAFCLPA